MQYLGILALGVFASPGEIVSVPIDICHISPDGNMVLGGFHTPEKDSFSVLSRWTQKSGRKSFTNMQRNLQGYANDCSTNGSVVCGLVGSSYESGKAFVWNQRSGMRILSTSGSMSVAMSSDGKWVVGDYRQGVNRASAPFRWSRSTGLQKLPIPNAPNRGGETVAVSSDGSRVVGHVEVGPKHPVPQRKFDSTVDQFGPLYAPEWASTVAAIWNAKNELQLLGRPKPFFSTRATCCNRDATVIAGTGTTKIGDRPFLWTKQHGVVPLPMLPGSNSVIVDAMSPSGKLVFGRDFKKNIGLVWKVGGKVIPLTKWLSSKGVSTKGWNLESIWGVSDDELVFVGPRESSRGEDGSWLVSFRR